MTLNVFCCFDARHVDPFPCLCVIGVSGDYDAVNHALHLHLGDDGETISSVILLQFPTHLHIFEIDDVDAHAVSRAHHRSCHRSVSDVDENDDDEISVMANESDFSKDCSTIRYMIFKRDYL